MEALIKALIYKMNDTFLRRIGYQSYNVREVSFQIQYVSREILGVGEMPAAVLIPIIASHSAERPEPRTPSRIA